MLSTDLITATRSLLDEASASFWTDNDLYLYLSDGQREIVNYLLAIYKAKSQVNPQEELPEILASLEKTISGTSIVYVLAAPSDYLHLIDMQWGVHSGTLYPAFIRQSQRNTIFEMNNTFLAGTTTNPIVIVKGDSSGSKAFNFIPQVTGDYLGTYLRIPPILTASVNPLLPDNTKSAIVNYALASALAKDKNYSESSMFYQKFLQQIQSL